MHAVARPMFGRRIVHRDLEHRLKRNERGVVLIRDTPGRRAIMVELGKPFVVHRAATQTKGSQSTNFTFGSALRVRPIKA